MSSRRKEGPPLMVRKKNGALVPSSLLDAEMLDKYPAGAEIECQLKLRRSNPQNRLYWAILQAVVDSTDIQPTSRNLHENVLVELGYYTTVVRFDFTIERRPDSTRFEAMDGPAFQAYFDRAMALLAEATGIDPVELLNEGKRMVA